MTSTSPTIEGFRAAFRRPSIAFAEITWRWSVGATTIALFFYGLFEYLNSLPVTSSEMLLLRTRQPFLIGKAIEHILRGSLSRVAFSSMVAALLITALWIVAASLGRIATLNVLLDYFRSRFGGGTTAETQAERGARGSLASLHGLNFLRAALVLASMLACVGAAILVSFVSSEAHPRPTLAFFLFLPVAALVALVVWSLNWLLSLAALFSVRNGEDMLSAFSSAIALCRERTGAVFAVSSWTGLAHLCAFMLATTAASTPFGFFPLVPIRVVIAVVTVVTLLYFAVADWLYTARLAGYVCIAEMPESAFLPPPSPAPIITPPVRTSIDRDELILSDVPSPVLG
jgi:hypothetical protein